MPQAMASTFFTAPPASAPIMSVAKYGLKVGVAINSASSSAQPVSGQASVTAVGRPRATSPAKLGPDSTAGRACGMVSARTSVISFSDPCSIPLAQRTMRRPSRTCGAKALSVARKCWAGATASTTSLPARSAKSPVARIAGSRSTPGRKLVFSWLVFTAATTSASRAQSVV